MGDRVPRPGTPKTISWRQIRNRARNEDDMNDSQGSGGSNWWDVRTLPGLDSHFHQGWANIALVQMALKGLGPSVRTKSYTASLKEDIKFEAWVEDCVAKHPEFKAIADNEEEYVLASTTGALKLEYDGDSKVTAVLVTTSPDTKKGFEAWWKESTTKTMPKGRVHVLITGRDGPDFKSMGVGGEKLVRENYTEEVLRGYDRVVKDLSSENPAGRVAILDGKPGTGKTFLVRGLLDEVQDVIMVIVPANLVSQLAQPGMIPALVDLHKSRGGKPMVFLIEDADECLAPRMGDNMSSVSTILNLGDGILGQLLDIRIVATTNAHRTELDEAIMRPGRLSASVQVGPLPYEKAQEVFERLCPGKALKDGRYTLAELYSMARNEGWEPPKLEKNKVGFTTEDEDEYDPYE